VADRRFKRWHASLTPQLWFELKTRAAKAGLTPSAVLLAAYAETIAGWTRSESFTLNITVDDRQNVHPDVADMLGVFTTLTPLAIAQARSGAFNDRALAQQTQLAADLDQRPSVASKCSARLHSGPRSGSRFFAGGVHEPDREASFPEKHGLKVEYAITQTPKTGSTTRS
jgi:hypothetical protein